jgi:hypothetical protein
MLDLTDKRSFYNIYPIKKANGKIRIIHAPKKELKDEQKKLADALEKWYNPPDCVFGFIKGKSPKDLAQHHINKDWIVTLDIKDFFPSITKALLKELLRLDDYWIEVATYEDKLIQGSPASPILSNLVMLWQDKFFEMYAFVNGYTYSRYADDLVLSGMGKPKWDYINYIESHLNGLGFRLNKSKIKFMFKNQEQRVLGITVNDKVSLNHKVRKKLKNTIKYNPMSNVLQGYMAYVNSINKDQFNKIKEQTKG